MSDMKFHTYFGLYVAKKRQMMNLSQAKLAEKVGISTRHCSDLENGKANLHIDTMMSFVNALNLSMDEIIAEYNKTN